MLILANVADSLSAGALAWAVGWQEILVIVVIVLILFGGRKIPELAKGLGKGLREFKKEMRGVKQDFAEAIDNAEEEDTYSPPRRRKKRRKKRPEPAETAEVADEDDEAEGDSTDEAAAADSES
ncbi:MAG: twin-arginine translocase TatA/TatE family subunit [Phycisphaerae bacterium]